MARARTATAELARKQGRFVEAESELAAAEAAFVEVGDEAGQARVLHLRGTLASQQGHPDQARAAYEASLALREALGDEAGVAALLTNLALVAEDEDDLDERGAARPGGAGASPRARRPARGERLADQHGHARDRPRRARAGAATGSWRRTPWPTRSATAWLTAVGLPQPRQRDPRPRATSTRRRRTSCRRSTRTPSNDDRWSLAHLFEDVAVWLLARGPAGDAEAVSLLAAAERLREEIGAPRFPPTEAALDEALAPARDAHPGRRSLEEATASRAGRPSLEATVGRVRLVLHRLTTPVWKCSACERFADTMLGGSVRTLLSGETTHLGRRGLIQGGWNVIDTRPHIEACVEDDR